MVGFVESLAMLAGIRRRCFDIADDNVTVAGRGFRCCSPEVRNRLEQIGRTFLAGYRAAIAECQLDELTEQLKRHPSELKGFAYEGAAMGMALLDGLLPWRRPRLGKFVAGSADRHIYVAHVGAGWAIARLPFGAKRILRQLDPLLQSLAFDGYGFHQVYFAGAADFQSQTAPPTFDRNAHRAFDQGLVCGRPLLDFSEQRPDQKRRRPRR